MDNYITNKGIKLKAAIYKPGMETYICKKHNKPVIVANNKHIYISKEDYLFVFEGETEVGVLDKNLFESLTKPEHETVS